MWLFDKIALTAEQPQVTNNFTGLTMLIHVDLCSFSGGCHWQQLPDAALRSSCEIYRRSSNPSLSSPPPLPYQSMCRAALGLRCSSSSSSEADEWWRSHEWRWFIVAVCGDVTVVLAPVCACPLRLSFTQTTHSDGHWPAMTAERPVMEWWWHDCSAQRYCCTA